MFLPELARRRPSVHPSPVRPASQPGRRALPDRRTGGKPYHLASCANEIATEALALPRHPDGYTDACTPGEGGVALAVTYDGEALEELPIPS